MLRELPEYMASKARRFYETLNDEKHTNNELVLSVLSKIADGQKIPPDDWALVQETLDKDHPCAQFLAKHRNTISRQLVVDGKKYTSVPILTFTYMGEQYVLLMRNHGLEKSIDIGEVQWTAHGVRVDAEEKELLQDKSLWLIYEKNSINDVRLTYFIAAAVRRVTDIGIKLTEKDLLKIHPIDRTAAGFVEASPRYRTEYFDIDLGERNPDDLMRACSASESRYGQWTRCFKFSELKTGIIESKISKKSEQPYFLFYHRKKLPVRDTTWSFIKALQLLKEIELKPDSLTKDPWQLRNIYPLETAIRWVLQRTDSPVQFSLFSKENNRLTSAQLHAYSAKAKLNEENLAYTTMKPERLVLHSIIANLTVKTRIKDNKELQIKVNGLYKEFFEQNKLFKKHWEKKFIELDNHFRNLIINHLNDVPSDLEKLSIENLEDINQVKQYIRTLQSSELSEHHRAIYHLHESDLEIAIIIQLNKKFYEIVMKDIQLKVATMFDKSKDYTPLESYPLSERLCFGITGPVASGKSVSEKMIRFLLKDKTAAYIGSDEWNTILCHSDTPDYSMYRGNLTLPEAWFIKVLIWNMISEMEHKGQAPNWIHETCNPIAIKAPRHGNTMIFINTADPSKAADRVKNRGDKSGRYVSAGVASSSYRWPWINFLKIMENLAKNTIVKVIDTDLMYSQLALDEEKRMQCANIASVKNRTLEIHNMNHFLSFISRSYRVNPTPKNPGEIWCSKPTDSLSLLLGELSKLFQSELEIQVQYKGHELTKEAMFDLANKIYCSGIRPFEAARLKYLNLFSTRIKDNKNEEITARKILNL